MTQPLKSTGVAILLVYGAELTPPRNGKPGIRVTAGYHAGSVLLEAVGYNDCTDAVNAICKAAQTCLDADLVVNFAPHRMSNFPARIVFRKTA